MTDLEAIERARVLLKATRDLLIVCDNSPIMVDPMMETINYDDAECDGACLLQDIQIWLESDE